MKFKALYICAIISCGLLFTGCNSNDEPIPYDKEESLDTLEEDARENFYREFSSKSNGIEEKMEMLGRVHYYVGGNWRTN